MLFVLTGPESSGKSTLAHDLGAHFAAPCVAEAARLYLQDKTTYVPSDLLEIARLQQQAEQRTQGDLVFADTDLQVIYIWWQEKFGPAPERLSQAYADQSERHYLLCRPDLAWAHDLMRENPHDRGRLYALYKADLRARKLNYDEVYGEGDARLGQAITIVSEVLGR